MIHVYFSRINLEEIFIKFTINLIVILITMPYNASLAEAGSHGWFKVIIAQVRL